jgi:hypothetical protein
MTKFIQLLFTSVKPGENSDRKFQKTN